MLRPAPSSLLRLGASLLFALVFSPRSAQADDAAQAQQFFEHWVARARAARGVDFVCRVRALRPVNGTLVEIESTLEARIAKDGGRRFGRYIRRVPAGPGTESAEEGTAIVLADGEHSFTLDEVRQSFIRCWPPRFVGSGEGRSFLLFRAFLGEVIEQPVRVRRKGAEDPAETLLEMEFTDRIETITFDRDGNPAAVTKRDRVAGGTKTTFRFERFALLETADPQEFSCRPPGSYRDASTTTAKKSPISARVGPKSPPRGAQPGSLLEGDRDVDASFVTEDRALVRLANLRGRKIVLCFLDPESPTAPKERLIVERLARVAARHADPALFLVVSGFRAGEVPKGAFPSSAAVCQVTPARPEIEGAFGVLLPPTTFVLDEAGTVILRSAVALSEDRLRQVLGFE